MTADTPREPVTEAIRRLEALDATMTPGPWRGQVFQRGEDMLGDVLSDGANGDLGPRWLWKAQWASRSDADGIAYLRTHLPEIIAALWEARAAGLREAPALEALRAIVEIEDAADASWRDTSRGLFVEQLQELNETRRTAIANARALLAAPGAAPAEPATPV